MGGDRRAQYAEIVFGLVLVVAATAFVRNALTGTSFPDGAIVVTALLLAVGQSAPLVLRRVHPLAAWGVLVAACAVSWGMERALGLSAGRTTAVAHVVGLFVLYRIGGTARRRVAVLVAVATAAAVVAARPEPGWQLMALLVGASVLLGAVASALRTAEDGLAAQREARAGLTERARIARELHDVVAHHMSVVALQAESAPHRLRDLPAPAAEEFASIADGARAALDEMRQLLGTLRGEQQPERAPQPDLSEVDELVDAVRRTGLPVHVEIDGTLDDLSPLCATSAYRIVQEGLSNVVKHAPGAAVTVRLTRTARTLAIAIRNGPPTDRPARPGAGQGLLGVRERVALLSGSLRSGPTDEGGFLLEAELRVRR
jgi:signal transduction histidine kinase